MEGVFTIKTIVSVNTGDYDNIIEDHYLNLDWQFLMFTDRELKSNLWNPIKIDLPLGVKKQSRIYKWLIHEYTNCQYSLYIDANVKILCDLNELIDKYLRNSDIAMYQHRIRNCIYDEAIVCKKLNFDNKEIIEKQVNSYFSQGYPSNIGLHECYVILRRHTPKIKELNKLIWNEIEKGSHRDQLSFDYGIWKLGIKVNNFNGMIKASSEVTKLLEFCLKKEVKYINPYFELKEHKIKKKEIK